MKKIKYSPDAADKIREINQGISEQYGTENAKKIVKGIIDAINDLSIFEMKGPALSDLFGIDTDYRYLYVKKNYIFYRIDDECIRIINIYNEKEDFIWKLFGIETTSQETIDYWI